MGTITEVTKSRLMTAIEVCSVAENVGVRFDDHIPRHPGNVYGDRDDRDGVVKKSLEELQELPDQPACSVAALQRIQSLCRKARIYVLGTVLEAQNPTTQEFVAIPEKLRFDSSPFGWITCLNVKDRI